MSLPCPFLLRLGHAQALQVHMGPAPGTRLSP